MYQVKVKYGNKTYNYTRDKYDNSVRGSLYLNDDEEMFLDLLGIPKLDEDGTVARDQWKVSRLEKLLWYKFCLTLRSNFDKINPIKLNKILDEMIDEEFAKEGFGPQAKFEMIKQIEDEFKKVNHL